MLKDCIKPAKITGTAREDRENKRFKKTLTWMVIYSTLLLITTGCSFSRGKASLTAPSLQEPPEIKFYTFDVQKGDIKKEIKDAAKIVPSTETLIFSHFGGWLSEICVKSGDIIHKGDILVKFDTDSLEIKLKQQELALEKAVLNSNRLMEDIQRDIDLATLDLKNLEEKLNKSKQLRQELSKNNSASDLKQIDEEIENLQGSIIRQKMSLEGLNEKYEATKASLDIDMKKSELQIKNVRKELENAIFVSPIDGKITNLTNKAAGEYIGAYQTLASIVKIEDLHLVYSGSNVNSFEVGMKVKVILDKEELDGEVVSSPAYYGKNVPGNIKESVIINIKGLTMEHLTNLKGDVRINLVLEEKNDVVVVPKRVLNNHLGNKYVYVVENGIKKKRFVETGTETNMDVEITKGLNPGDKVIDS